MNKDDIKRIAQEICEEVLRDDDGTLFLLTDSELKAHIESRLINRISNQYISIQERKEIALQVLSSIKDNGVINHSDRNDVFISYRRDGGLDFAGRLSDHLKGRGFRPFMDIEAMKSGRFDSQLYKKIDECRHFILILSPKSLDRCKNKEDWVRKEVEHAIEKHKHIITLQMPNFSFPRRIPKSIEAIKYYQAIMPSPDMFEVTVDKVVQFLRDDWDEEEYPVPSGSDPKARISKRFIALVVSLAITLCAVGLLIHHFTRNDTNISIVDQLTVGWSDSNGGREDYTLEEVNQNILGDRVVMNSISDGKIGHEFNFVGASDNMENDVYSFYANTLVARENTSYKVRLYFENSNLFKAAEEVCVKYEITNPFKVTENDIDVEGLDSSRGYYAVAVYGIIQATNTDPTWVRDGVKFVSDKPFHLEYIPGTAVLQNMGIGKSNSIRNGYSLPNTIIEDWVMIGYDSLNGIIPAGYEYDGQCTILVVPVFD